MHGKQKSPGPSPSDIQNLIATHLRQIWSQPLSSRRRALFEQVYHPEIIVYEHDGGVLTGFDHVDSKIEALTGQGGPFAGQEFRIDSEGIKWNGDFAWVGWELGPPTVAGGEEIEAKVSPVPRRSWPVR